MRTSKDNKTYKVSRKRKKNSNKTTDQAATANQPTAGSSTKQDDETGEVMVKPSKQLKIEKPPKEVQGTDDDSFKSETTDDSDLPSHSRSLNLNEPVTEDDSINLEESIIQEWIPDDPPPASQSETEVTQCEAQTSSGVSGELKPDDSTATSKEKEQKKIESAGKLETELDTDASSTITCSSKERGFSDTGSDKESSDSDGSKGVSLSSGNKESESGSVSNYLASDESGPPSVASVVSSQPSLDIDSRSADQENTSESKNEGNVQQNNPNVPEFMLKKYKEFSSSSGSDNKNEEA